MAFPTSVARGIAPSVEGDFASANPWASVVAGPGGLVAGTNGLVAGRFAWWSAEAIDGDGAPSVANNYGAGPVTGFVHRDMSGSFLGWPPGIEGNSADDLMRILPGMAATLLSRGDFWVKNRGATQALPGMKAFARFKDGSISFAAAGAAGDAGSTVTGGIAPATASGTGSITDDLLTITGAPTGTFRIGMILTGTGVKTGTQIVAQRTGAAGGAGVYVVNFPGQTVAATTITGTAGIATITAGDVSGLAAGDVFSGTGVTAGTRITAVNADGTYTVTPSQTVAGGTALVAGGSVETKWYCQSSGLPGELVKISDQPQG
jgi:hypothetical protein